MPCTEFQESKKGSCQLDSCSIYISYLAMPTQIESETHLQITLCTFIILSGSNDKIPVRRYNLYGTAQPGLKPFILIPFRYILLSHDLQGFTYTV